MINFTETWPERLRNPINQFLLDPGASGAGWALLRGAADEIERLEKQISVSVQNLEKPDE